MKSYTDLEQSKELAKILPLESADMRYTPFDTQCPWVWNEEPKLLEAGAIPCWSLAALLDYLSANLHTKIACLSNHWEVDCLVAIVDTKELIDACYKMIVTLKEKNWL